MMTTARALDMGSFVVERVREQPRRRRERDDVARIAKAAYREAGGRSPTGGVWVWTPHRVTWIRPDAVVKVGRVKYGENSLRNELAARSRIHRDPGTEALRRLVASTHWSGSCSGRFTVVEERLTGTPLEALMHDSGLLATVGQEVSDVRRTTTHSVTADDNRVLCWFVGPAANVTTLLKRWGRRDLGDAVAAWARKTAEGLRGHTCQVCLVHGDLWPGNALVHRGGVSGLVDWDQAAFHDAALHDVLHFSLVPLARERRVDLGLLVREALIDNTGEGGLQKALGQEDFEQGCLDMGLSARDALIWYWLRHTARMSVEPGHANNPRWVARNLVAVASVLKDRKLR